MSKTLPLPDFFPSAATNGPRRLHYQKVPAFASFDPDKGKDGLLELAEAWRTAHQLTPSRDDKFRVILVGIDYADTFGHPRAELGVPGAPEDGWRWAKFLLKYMAGITDDLLTFDSHFIPHVFHTPMWRYRATGKHPDPLTQITVDNYHEFEPSEFACYWTGKDRRYLEQYLAHYVHELAKPRTFNIQGQDRLRPRDALTLWPLHAQMGSMGYSLFPEVEEAVVFHQLARGAKLIPQVKGLDKLTEAYSPFGSEVTKDHNGQPVGRESEQIISLLLTYHMVIIGGEAASHCVRAGIYDILGRILAKNRALARNIYILKDCMSPVPGFEAQAQQAMQDFQDAGMNLVLSTDDIRTWQGDAAAAWAAALAC